MCPIELRELEEKGKEVGTEPRASRVEAVLAMLKANPKAAYTQAEVAKKVGIRPTHANQILRGLVEKKTARRAAVNQDGKTLIYYALK